ncbi:MAG: hypothetical protein R2711_16100 [Acidimicrobiales bacterium]
MALVELVELSDAVVTVLPSVDVLDELDEVVAVAAEVSPLTVAATAKAPVRARNVPALTTAAVRRALGGCGGGVGVGEPVRCGSWLP